MSSLRNCSKFDFNDICKELSIQFGPQSPYNMEKRQEYMELRRLGKIEGPIHGKWLHGGMIKFLENYAANKTVLGDPSIKGCKHTVNLASGCQTCNCYFKDSGGFPTQLQ